jgi:hypothetical protein
VAAARQVTVGALTHPMHRSPVLFAAPVSAVLLTAILARAQEPMVTDEGEPGQVPYEALRQTLIPGTPGMPGGYHLMINAYGQLQNVGLGGYRIANDLRQAGERNPRPATLHAPREQPRSDRRTQTPQGREPHETFPGFEHVALGGARSGLQVGLHLLGMWTLDGSLHPMGHHHAM